MTCTHTYRLFLGYDEGGPVSLPLKFCPCEAALVRVSLGNIYSESGPQNPRSALVRSRIRQKSTKKSQPAIGYRFAAKLRQNHRAQGLT